jgi:hypothetical protein
MVVPVLKVGDVVRFPYNGKWRLVEVVKIDLDYFTGKFYDSRKEFSNFSLDKVSEMTIYGQACQWARPS